MRFCEEPNIEYYSNSNIPQQTNASNITTYGNVNLPTMTYFKAHESILLNPGFEVPIGKEFNAIIDSCED